MADAVFLKVVQSIDPALPVGTLVSVPPNGGVIGRSPEVECCFPGQTVSRVHAAIRPGECEWLVIAKTSKNAVFLGEERLTEGIESPWHDEPLQVGGVVVTRVTEGETLPVVERLQAGVLLQIRDDGGAISIHAGETLLELPNQCAQLLASLAATPGEPVHRWDLLEALGEQANLDKIVSQTRSALVSWLDRGILDRSRVAEAVGAGAEATSKDLAKQLLLTRRGHGYALVLRPSDVGVSHL